MTDQVKCINCKRLSLKESSIGKNGFGYCPAKSRTKGHTFSASYPRTCDRFIQAEPEQVAARERYIGDF